jgi:hypothetical protein
VSFGVLSRPEQEAQVKALAAALLAVQKDAPSLQKNAINPHFRNRYISLDALMEQVLPVLNKHGIALVQAPSITDDSTPTLRTTLLHAESGEAIEDSMPLYLPKEDPQGQGSAITYARRYSLMAMLGLVADEDDDANGASARPAATTAAPAASAPADPAASYATQGGGATEKQIGFARKLLAKFPPDTAHSLLGSLPGGLEGASKRDVSAFIEKLKTYVENGGAAPADPDGDIPF